MSRIWQYLLERFPPALMGSVSVVLALGSLAKFSLTSGMIVSPALFLYLLELRLFDEFKDAAHDQKFYPTRPVPRGLVTLRELNFLLGLDLLGQVGLLAISGASWPLFIFLQGYTWLMRQEFGVKEWLRRYFTAYLLSHEVVVLPLFLYLMSLTAWSSVGQALFLGLGLFSLEIARKTIPRRVGAYDTYFEHYGAKGTLILLLAILTLMAGLFVLQSFPALLAPTLVLSLIAVVLSLHRLR